MAPNQYGDDDVSLMLDLETRQRQDAAAREALGEPPAKKPAPKKPQREKPAQRAERPTDRA
jgi:hypothetical protein